MSELEIVMGTTPQWQRADVLAALTALCHAGALRVASRGGVSGTTSYTAAGSLNRTIDTAAAVASILPSLRQQFDREQHATLVVSWPTALRELRLRRWRNSRITLVEMVDQAKESIVLVFPFIDAIGVQEMAPAIERSFSRGVKVVLLTRYLSNADSPNAQFVSRLLRAPGGDRHFEAINISSDGDPRRELLHAKVLLVDGGARGYVGSANLTGSAFGDSIEIGVVVYGAAAASVAELVSELLSWGRAV